MQDVEPRDCVSVAQIFLQNYDALRAPLQLNCVFALVRAEPDRLGLQIVSRADEAHGLAFRAHQNGMRRGLCPLTFHAAQERTIADSGRAKNNVFAVGQIIRRENAIQTFFVAIIDEFLPFLFIARPHFCIASRPRDI